MKPARWFLPEQPDVVRLLRAQLAITIEGLDAYVEWAGGDEPAAQLVTDAEERGDAAKRSLLDELRAAFVLPLEPEDVFALSRSIDRILDLTCDLVAEAEVMDCRPDEGLAEMAQILAEGARRLDEAVATLATGAGRRPSGPRPRSRPSTSSSPPTTGGWRRCSRSRTEASASPCASYTAAPLRSGTSSSTSPSASCTPSSSRAEPA